MKCIYLVCALGITTSTMLRVKIEDYLEKTGIEAEIHQYSVEQMLSERIKADVILTTTVLPAEIKDQTCVIEGMPLLDGSGPDLVFEELEKILRIK